MVELFTEEGHEYLKKVKQYYREHPEEAGTMRQRWWDSASESFLEGIKKQLEKQEKNLK